MQRTAMDGTLKEKLYALANDHRLEEIDGAVNVL